MLLSVSLTSPQRAQSLPPVTLTSFQFDALTHEIVRIEQEPGVGRHRRNYWPLKNVIWEGKRQLDIPLSSEPVDVGQLLTLRFAKSVHHLPLGSPLILVPSFKSRKMERTYDLSIELVVELHGKKYYA